MASKLYEQDYYAWTQEQAAKLRASRVAEIDLEDLAEEIESLGRSEWYELVNRLAVLLAHLLKWRCQPSRRSNSWRLTIKEQRRRVLRSEIFLTLESASKNNTRSLGNTLTSLSG